MPNYINRRAGRTGCSVPEKPNIPKKEETIKSEEAKPSNTGSEVPKPKTNDSLSTIQCGKKILSITKVGDKVVVMYDDCSYSTAPLDVVAKESFAHEALQCIVNSMKAIQENQKTLEAKVKELADKPDNDNIYDDTAVQNRLTALENKADNDTVYDDSAVRTQITNLDAALNAIKEQLPKLVHKDELVIVENLEGTKDLFKAFPL